MVIGEEFAYEHTHDLPSALITALLPLPHEIVYVAPKARFAPLHVRFTPKAHVQDVGFAISEVHAGVGISSNLQSELHTLPADTPSEPSHSSGCTHGVLISASSLGPSLTPSPHHVT